MVLSDSVHAEALKLNLKYKVLLLLFGNIYIFINVLK